MRLPGMPPPTMPLEELQRELTRIIETPPTLPDSGPIPPDYMQWAADAYARIVATGLIPLQPEAQVAINGLTFENRVTKREQLMMILHKARSQIELEMQQSVASKPTSADLLSPYYTRDPRTSGMDPRTSHMGFRPQPDGDAQTPITGVQANGGVANIVPSQVAGDSIGDDAIGESAIGSASIALTADNIAHRIAADPDFYSNLATNAAGQIRAAIGDLEAQKPNEPDALNGYERVNNVLTSLATDLETIASQIDLVGTEAVPEAKNARLREIGNIFLETYDGFVGWFGEHATIAGRVIAHIGLAGTISGALSYFAGVPPMIAFPVTIGALNGENIWEVIKLFAPKGRDNDKTKNPPA